MIHAAAIRSTGMSACFGIAERVTELLAEAGLELGDERAVSAGPAITLLATVVAPLSRVLVRGRMSEVLLGLDVGTTGVKAVLVDSQLQPLTSASRRIPTQHPIPAGSSSRARTCLSAAVDAVADVLAEAPVKSRRVGSTTRVSR